jgi:copper homeostasis protein (lipoprotein)
MTRPGLSLSLILALVLAGGARATEYPAPRASALNGTAWTLASLPGHGLLPAHPGTLRIDGNRPELRAADGALQVTATPRDDAHAGTGHASGATAASTLPYELVSDRSLTPTDLKLPLAGEMVYFADAARFTECLTGRNYPMAMEGAFPDAERAYLAARSAPAAPLYVTFEGAIVPRPKMEGDGLQPTIVVNRFIAAWPNERCERAMADASLVNTYWRIVRLAGDPVRAAEGRREPHLILRGDGRQQTYTATIGCNGLAGSYALEGELIGIAPAAATRITCPSPLDALEAKLRNALEGTARWQILGKTLELFDAAGAQTMLLEAVYL